MDLTPENIVEEQHKAWLRHPTTIQMFKNFEKQKLFLMETMAAQSTDVSLADSIFRLNAHSIKMINNLVKQTKETTLFIQQSEK